MDFSSLVLMERDKETGLFKKEIGSYSVGDGAEYVRKLYVIENEVTMIFDTKVDVEEWQFSAIFDLFNKKAFEDLGYKIEDIDEEYNPTFKINFSYEEEHEEMKAIINELCNLIKVNMHKVFKDIKGKEQEYK
ncbi:hypothetical protein SAMN02745163_00511 [Clostridium cavendishii DSM 21758]|uniref:Uncharacterized protein n=1 Tax=Clostridium cavendishii DSM 21758 TaxID=1121302 RepID=A0A1M6CNI9_9CLOT|nr:DUF6762 family protein [Clostridium cavendishii]SHI62567.1 hypothetical protein SAMN02745163_00511 [Clostridium cavendishii DSM 21758]